jgi:predicted RNA methylase
VSTPLPIVKLVWHLINARRPSVDTVIDLGAGDGRFAQFGRYRSYVGYELDRDKIAGANLPRNAALKHACVLEANEHCSAAVGNPPFIRNQDLGTCWRRRARSVIYEELRQGVNPFSNLYLYFIWLALARTVDDGIVGLVVPFDWTYRPSAKSLRDFIKRKGWAIEIYRLTGSRAYFPGVKTTASVSIIDKTRSGVTLWEVAHDFSVRAAEKTGAVFDYVPRADIYACRGFSPGSQAVFALTESERKQARIPATAVVPCVTSLRGLPRNLAVLNVGSFRRHFVQAGRKCWLLQTQTAHLSPAVSRWLMRFAGRLKNNTTCRTRKVWFRYLTPAAPQILIASGFRADGPRLMLNALGARNLGSVFGILGVPRRVAASRLLKELAAVDFKAGVVADARGFRRIEVRQVNSVLAKLPSQKTNGRKNDG